MQITFEEIPLSVSFSCGCPNELKGYQCTGLIRTVMFWWLSINNARFFNPLYTKYMCRNWSFFQDNSWIIRFWILYFLCFFSSWRFSSCQDAQYCTRRGRVECSRVYWCSSVQIMKRCHRKYMARISFANTRFTMYKFVTHGWRLLSV